MFHGTVDGYLELVARFTGMSLEPRSREPGREITYCPRFRQLLVGVVRVLWDARIGIVSTRNFPGTAAAANASVASSIIFRNGSSHDLTSIP